MRTKDFIDKWSDLKSQKGFTQRIDPKHPLDFFVRINEKGCEQLLLFTTLEPAQMKSSKALEVVKNKRKDGKWATQISSVESENQEIFARLCVDLVEASSSCINERDGINKVTSRFFAWQKLFATMKETLPISVLKGLVGEISFIKFLIEAKGLKKDDVINAWCGPDGADRDFTIEERWFEIKSISTGKDKVIISSLNQLEITTQGYLVIYCVDEASSTDSTAISITEFIKDMKDFLSDAPEASRIFEEKLVSVGFMSKRAYDNIYFKIGGKVFFCVNDSFPKLLTENVPTEIVEAQYALSLAGIEPWKVDESSIWSY